MSRFIYVTRFLPPRSQLALDGVRAILKTSVRRPAHLSLLGPYDVPLPSGTIASLNSRIRSPVECVGVDTFFGDNQGTIFLACEATPELRAVWDKPGLTFSPHITLYDGELDLTARRMYELLGDGDFSFPLTPRPLEEWRIGDSTSGKVDFLAEAASRGIIPRVMAEGLSLDDRVFLARDVLLELANKPRNQPG